MKAKEIEDVLSADGRLVLRDYPFGKRYFVKNGDGVLFSINERQFTKFKIDCNRKDESEMKFLRGETITWYYWRE